MMLDVEAMKIYYSKENLMLENLFLVTECLIIGIHYLNSVLIAAPYPVIIDN